MMEIVPHVTSGSGLRKFLADRFLLFRKEWKMCMRCLYTQKNCNIKTRNILTISNVHAVVLMTILLFKCSRIVLFRIPC